MGIFSDVQGQLTLQSVVQSGKNSNSFELSYVSLATLEFTCSVICLKSDVSAGPFSCAATFIKYLLKTFAISLSSEIS